MDAPVFVIPIFRDLETEELVLQISEDDDIIRDFEKLPAGCSYVSYDHKVIKKNGEAALYGVAIDGSSVFLVKKNLSRAF